MVVVVMMVMVMVMSMMVAVVISLPVLWWGADVTQTDTRRSCPLCTMLSSARELCTMLHSWHCRGCRPCIVAVIDLVRFPTWHHGFVKYLYLDLSSYLELQTGDCESDLNHCCYSNFRKCHYFLFFWLCGHAQQEVVIANNGIYTIYIPLIDVFYSATKYYDSLTQRKKQI